MHEVELLSLIQKNSEEQVKHVVAFLQSRQPLEHDSQVMFLLLQKNPFGQVVADGLIHFVLTSCYPAGQEVQVVAFISQDAQPVEHALHLLSQSTNSLVLLHVVTQVPFSNLRQGAQNKHFVLDTQLTQLSAQEQHVLLSLQVLKGH